MKRVIAAVVILLIIIAASTLAMLDMQHSLDLITEKTALLRSEADETSPEELAQRCRGLMEEWDKLEKRFLLYVRHDHLDNIMEHLSELPAYCLEEDNAELLSNLDVSVKMMLHLRESITPNIQTLL